MSIKSLQRLSEKYILVSEGLDGQYKQVILKNDKGIYTYYKDIDQEDDNRKTYHYIYGPEQEQDGEPDDMDDTWMGHVHHIQWSPYTPGPRTQDLLLWIKLGFPKAPEGVWDRMSLEAYHQRVIQRQAVLNKDNPGIEMDI